MNEKFFSLPQEKQQAIINAGHRVFSENSYKKSPMSEIAAAAGISKSLLFHYFYNKRELYLFLWEVCAKMTVQYLREYGCYEQTDLFEMMYRGMKAKMSLVKEYPYMGAFVIKAFCEKDPEVCMEIQTRYRKMLDSSENIAFKKMDTSQFVPGLDLKMMYREMYLTSEGALWEMVQRGEENDFDKMEREFTELLEFWKKMYLRNGGEHGSN